MEKQQVNGNLDITKFIMAILVCGIHTQPFGFNVWLDRGFGILTRICVPFFFVASAYLYWKKEEKPKKAAGYVKRIALLYFVWCVLYFPFDLKILKKMQFKDIMMRYFWHDNRHLWFLWACLVGFLITVILLKFFDKRIVLIIGVCLLVIGCAKTTWKPFIESLLHCHFPDYLGIRNGLYYGFPYMSIGMYIAKSKNEYSLKRILSGLLVSFFALVMESFIFVVIFRTDITILWITVMPLSYYFFLLILKLNIPIEKNRSLYFRKMSSLIYCSHVFIRDLISGLEYIPYFIIVLLLSMTLSAIILYLAERRGIKCLGYLY